ncbi:hypothetical protein BC834DRAFT_956783 [Gloeopeniophorella convolvens]|nr:hypothetical protein BC834DRAFT_956783 [Gloeopeniophorella convolvens]
MSFSGTPLGQGRRLDHQTFLNKRDPSLLKQAHLVARPHAPAPAAERSIPTSYAYGAPTLGTRSPPKPLSAASSRDDAGTADHSSHHPANTSQDDPALVRFARLKQREQAHAAAATNLANLGPRTTTENPDPTKFAMKSTSVQAANALHQAAMAVNPNDSWASSSRTVVPRSTSLEYEKETFSTSTRRLNPPPSRSATTAKKLTKQQSVRYVPDSEGEEAAEAPTPRGERAKTPLDSVIDLAKRTAFYLRQRSTEPDLGQADQSQSGHRNGDSYDYEEEERNYQSLSAASTARKTHNSALHKRGRISVDNKAYRPSESEESDEDFIDDDKKRRKKIKKGMVGHLTTLPVVGQDKRRRRRRSTKGDGEAAEGEEEEESGSDDRASPQHSVHSSQRLSQPRDLQKPPSRAASISRASAPPPTAIADGQVADASLESYEQGLDSIPEIEEPEKEAYASGTPKAERPRAAFSAGASLGYIVNFAVRALGALFVLALRGLSAVSNSLGQGLGGAFDVLVNQPTKWLRTWNPAPLFKWLIVLSVLYAAWLGLNKTNFTSYIPSLPSRGPRYQAPSAPAADVTEIAARLQALENALAGLSFDSEQSRARIDTQARSQSDVSGRLGALESRLQKESARASEDRSVDRVAASQGLQAVRHEVETLRSTVSSIQRSEGEVHTGPANDEEARAKLSALEERVGSVEGSLRESLELSKNPIKSGGSVPDAAWWNKITSSGKKALSIKAPDGQDVTELLGHLVDTAMTRYSKDTLAKTDFALHSGGASVIPSLTSDTLEIKPQGFRQQLIGIVTGNGYAIGRSPITALHHETHSGHCWPFPSDQGQLGVLLAHPVRIEEISIDHVARDVALDMRSAPRKMEVWGVIDGTDNAAKLAAWEASRLEAGLEVPAPPKSLPRSATYMRIAEFEYDIDAPNAVQTFPVDEDVRVLGVDFGVVALRVLSNWGKEFTCLYRFRVHGQKLEELVEGAPTPDEPTS